MSSYIQWKGNNQQEILRFFNYSNIIYFKKSTDLNLKINNNTIIEELYIRYDQQPPLYVPFGYYIMKDDQNQIKILEKIFI